MLINLFICGATSLNSVEQDDESPMSANSSPSSTPRRSRFCKTNDTSKTRDKNPYATRGLDKFSALLADLEEKRRKIYTENGSDPDISFVRFVYKNSNDLVPVVVKLKDNNKAKTKTSNKTTTTKEDNEIIQTVSSGQSKDNFPIETSAAVKEVIEESRSQDRNGLVKKETKKIMIRPSYYLPIVVIFILVLLSVFGRSVAIMCTAIGWYVVPTLKENGTYNKRSSMKKKDYAKNISQRKIASEGLLSSPRAYCFAGGLKYNSNK